MDFEGQKMAESWMVRLLVAFALVGFLSGYVSGNFTWLVYINAAGLATTLAVVVPDWPCFKQHPLDWLPPLNPGAPAPAAATGVAPVTKPAGRRKA